LEVPSNGSFYSFLKKTFTGSSDKIESKSEDHGEIDLINNLEDYFNTTIREVMIPRPQMVTIDKSQPIEDAITIIHETGHSRIPVEDKKRDNIVGIIYAIDLFKYIGKLQETRVHEVMRKPLFASYSQQIHHLLANFKKNRIHLAIVIDEHGGVDGLVTVEDVIEELVGDIPDEFNKNNDPSYEQNDDGSVLLDANFPLDEFNELYQSDFQKEGIETIGGYICHSTGKIPEKGEKIALDDIEFLIVQSSEKRLDKLRIVGPIPKNI